MSDDTDDIERWLAEWDIVTNSATLDRLYLYNRPSWIIFRSKEEDLTEIEKSGCLYQVSSHVLLNNVLKKKNVDVDVLTMFE